MSISQPTFPPLLSGHRLEAEKNPMQWASSRARKGKLGAGDLAWVEDSNCLRFALVLEPEVRRENCSEMLFALMVAFTDAAGALIPPEVAIHYQWPNRVLLNEGEVGFVDLMISDEETDGVPDWMVVSLNVRLLPDKEDMNPGEQIHRTTFWDEGCGDVTSAQLLESVSRHTVNAIHLWSEDGFKAIHEQWMGRLMQENRIAQVLSQSAILIGLDEHGNAILSDGSGNMLVTDALNQLRENGAMVL